MDLAVWDTLFMQYINRGFFFTLRAKNYPFTIYSKINDEKFLLI